MYLIATILMHTFPSMLSDGWRDREREWKIEEYRKTSRSSSSSKQHSIIAHKNSFNETKKKHQISVLSYPNISLTWICTSSRILVGWFKWASTAAAAADSSQHIVALQIKLKTTKRRAREQIQPRWCSCYVCCAVGAVCASFDLATA